MTTSRPSYDTDANIQGSVGLQARLYTDSSCCSYTFTKPSTGGLKVLKTHKIPSYSASPSSSELGLEGLGTLKGVDDTDTID